MCTRLFFLLVLSGLAGNAFGQCLSSWAYLMPVTINNPNVSVLTNFQVRLTVNTATPIGAGQMLASGDDIRFTDGSCNNIQYWIESGLNTATTYIWVKVPSLAASGNTVINMYYGNVSAPAASSGDSTFLFFDDFNDNVFNTTKWTTRGTPSTLSESGGILTVVGNSNWEYIRSNTTWNSAVVIESRERATGPSAAMVLGYAGTDSRYTFRLDNTTKGTTQDPDVSGGNAWFSNAYPNVPHPNSGIFNDFQLQTDFSGNTIVVNSFCNQTTSNCNTTPTLLNSYTGTGYYVGFSTYSTGYIEEVDWIRVRSFAAQSPVSTNGSQQLNQAILTGTLSAAYCAGDMTTLNFTAGGSYVSGNVYTAELSDASGSFAVPVSIGTLNSNSTGALSMSIPFPPATPAGAGYRVRVVSSTPVTTGADNGTNIAINILPVVTITASASICMGGSDTLNASGASTYSWSSGGTAAVEIVSPVSNSTYTITGIDANGCSGTATVSVTVNNLPNVTASSVSGTTCDGESDTLNASGALAYAWSSGGSSATEIVSPSATTTYTVTGTDSNGCTNTATINVNVNALPNVNAAASSGNICAGENDTLNASGALTYSWSSGGSNAMEIVSPSASTTYTVTGTDSNGCMNTATVSVNVNALPNVNAVASSGTVCAGSTDTLNASGALTYSWSSGGSNATETVSPAVTTTYTVTGTDANNCMNSDTVTVTVNALPGAALGNDVEQCGGSVLLDAGSGAASYLWNDSSTGQTLTATSTGNYSVTTTGSNGCTNSDTISVTINTPPTASGSASSATVCLNDAAVSLTGTPAGGTWSGPGVTGSTFNPLTAGNGAQTATYIYTDGNGCSDTATVIITVNPCTGLAEQNAANVFQLYPNPNNGTFTVALNSASSVELTIYDAQGKLVLTRPVQAHARESVTLAEAGLYTISIITESGARMMQRVVVSR
ncbi:MAG: hypothetical protein FD123_1681 [Bacteroidetes bacterium]|nr:MAG: hypothetical protein FD123_1681 [Bacteroidota bacterium]